MSAFSRIPLQTAMLSRLLRVSLATSNFKIEVYKRRFAPKFSVLTLKEVSALVQNYVKKLGAKKNIIK